MRTLMMIALAGAMVAFSGLEADAGRRNGCCKQKRSKCRTNRTRRVRHNNSCCAPTCAAPSCAAPACGGCDTCAPTCAAPACGGCNSCAAPACGGCGATGCSSCAAPACGSCGGAGCSACAGGAATPTPAAAAVVEDAPKPKE